MNFWLFLGKVSHQFTCRNFASYIGDNQGVWLEGAIRVARARGSDTTNVKYRNYFKLGKFSTIY